jgi:hypothetical protein
MDVTKILVELRAEREQLEEAILTLERLAHRRGKRRGRPPAWLSTEVLAAPVEKRRGRPPGSKNKVHPAEAGETGSAAAVA